MIREAGTAHPRHPRTQRHIVVVADLGGGDNYHVGDEAMAEANVAMLRAAASTELIITLTSTDPAWTAARYGCGAVPWVGFVDCADDEERHRLLNRYTRAPSVDDSPLLAAVADADAVIISGGGNLNSQWPEHVFERVLIGRVAARRQVPVVLTGQTIGPRLDGRHRHLVAELVRSARLVGVREPHSAALAADLGVDASALLAQADDAVAVGTEALPGTGGAQAHDLVEGTNRWIAVTVHPIAERGDLLIKQLSTQVAEAADRVGADLVYAPHVTNPAGPLQRSDVDIADEMAAMTGGRVLDTCDTTSARLAAANAWLVVTTRYHPIVFATAAGTPALALPSDHYTAVKALGALGHVGLGAWHLNLADIGDGRLAAAVGEMARRRGELAGWLGDAEDHLRHLERQRQSRVLNAVGLPDDHLVERHAHFDPTIRPDRPRPAGSWAQG